MGNRCEGKTGFWPIHNILASPNMANTQRHTQQNWPTQQIWPLHNETEQPKKGGKY